MGSAKYNAANQLIERDEEELSYDKDGNLVEDGANEYEWDARGQLNGISGAAGASFSHDPFGRRTSKTIGEATTGFLHDGANVAQEYKGEELAATVLTGLQMDQLFSRTAAGGTDSYLTDRLGSATALANGSKEVTASYTYEPFGSSAIEGESDTPFQFTGRPKDGTGLQFNRARYYDPIAGRFISQDPAGFIGSGPNLYNYVWGNPLDFVDPTGELGFSIPNPLAPIDDFLHDTWDQIGTWVSDAPGVASDASDFLFGTFTTAEQLRAVAGEALGAVVCGFAIRVAAGAPEPRAKAVAGLTAAATCSSLAYSSAYNLGTDLGDDD